MDGFLLWLGALLVGWAIVMWVVFLKPILEERKLIALRERLTHLFKMQGRPTTVRRVLVVLNAASGDGLGGLITSKVLLPVLRVAGISVVLVETQPRTRIQIPTDWRRNDVVAIVGGDGTVHQFINSLVTENDGDVADLKAFLETCPPLCIIPAGSSNGLAVSLGGDSFEAAIENLLWGEKVNGKVAVVDFTDLDSGKKRRILDPHLVSWGITAEHDLFQEVKLRNRFFNKTLRGIIAPLIVMLQAKHTIVDAVMTPVALTPQDLALEQHCGQFFTPVEATKEITIQKSLHAIFLCGQAYGDSTGRACPGAVPSDGSFHAICFFRQGVWSLLRTFFLIHTGGRHVDHSPVNSRFKICAMTVKPIGQADDTMSHLLSLSGELYWFRDSFHLQVLPDSISFLVKQGRLRN